MIVYNVTVKIDFEIQEDWLTWMKETHIPDVLNTGFFTGNTIYKLWVDDQDGVTYSIQYTCDSKELLQQYFDTTALSMQAKHQDRYAGKYVAFRSVLEKV